MNTVTTLFLSTFTTLLAIINPLAVLPVFLKLLEGQDSSAHRRIAWKACSYATLLLFFFLIFGALLLKVGKDKVEEVWSGDEQMSNHYTTCVYHDGFLYGFHGRQEPGCGRDWT